MITIIHGDDTAASRVQLNELRSKSPEAALLDGTTVTLTDLTQIIDGGGLFQNEKTVIIERLYTRKKAAKEFEALVSYLQSKTLENEIILWEDKELDKRSLSVFRHATVKDYKLPQTLFLFLDSIAPRQGAKLVQLFHKVLTTTEAEMVFFMLVRQIRLLLALHEKSSEQIDEVKRLAPWQLNKLQRQAVAFSSEQLISLHTHLFEIDHDMKTGELSTPLSTAIDIFLLSI